jgi:hypothetical protein
MSVHEWHFQINLADESGAQIPATVDCEAKYWNDDRFTHRDCSINLKFRDTQLAATDRDFFEALCRLREQLVILGLSPLCYGACRNVFPSGMLRDMGRGLRAYRLELGRRGKPEVVDIFDSGNDLDIVSVETQRDFYDEWLKQTRGAVEQIVGCEPR